MDEVIIEDPTVQDMKCMALYNTLKDREDFDDLIEIIQCSDFERFLIKHSLLTESDRFK